MTDKNTVNITISVTREERKEMKQIALDEDISVSVLIRRLLTKYDYGTCTLVADYTDGLKGVMPKEVEGVYAPYEFEGKTFMGVKDYDYYLTQMYGDYMKIPDGDHQRQHNFHILDLDHPYKDYQKNNRHAEHLNQ